MLTEAATDSNINVFYYPDESRLSSTSASEDWLGTQNSVPAVGCVAEIRPKPTKANAFPAGHTNARGEFIKADASDRAESVVGILMWTYRTNSATITPNPFLSISPPTVA